MKRALTFVATLLLGAPEATAFAEAPRISSENFAPEMFALFCLNPQAAVTRTNAAIASAVNRHMAMTMSTADADKVFGKHDQRTAWILNPPPGGKPTFLAATGSGRCEINTYASFTDTVSNTQASLHRYTAEHQAELIENSTDFLRGTGQVGNAYTIKQQSGTIAFIIVRSNDAKVNEETQIKMIALTQ